MAKMLVLSPDKCTGCRLCEIVCSLKNTGEINPARARIHVIGFDDLFPVPVTCLQCSFPYCAEICSVHAIIREKTTGIVKVSTEKCTNCKMCIMACPFGNIAFSLEEKRVTKCEYCDGKPICVSFCPTGAIEFREADSSTTHKHRALEKNLKQHLAESQLYKQRAVAEKLLELAKES